VTFQKPVISVQCPVRGGKKPVADPPHKSGKAASRGRKPIMRWRKKKLLEEGDVELPRAEEFSGKKGKAGDG